MSRTLRCGIAEDCEESEPIAQQRSFENVAPDSIGFPPKDGVAESLTFGGGVQPDDLSRHHERICPGTPFLDDPRYRLRGAAVPGAVTGTVVLAWDKEAAQHQPGYQAHGEVAQILRILYA